MPTSVSGVTDRYLSFVSEQHPVFATYLGLHSHDDKLGDFSSQAMAARREELGAMLDELDAVPSERASSDEQADREILRIALRSSIFSHDTLRDHERNPVGYIGAALSGCNQLLLRDFAPLEERLRCFASRLREVPDVLAACRRNVPTPPSAFAAVAAGYARGGLAFLESTIPKLASEAPALESDLRTASSEAAVAFRETAQYYASGRGEDIPFHIGKEAYEWLLREEHLLAIDSEELLETGLESVAVTARAMEETAAEINPSSDWREVVDDLQRRHPEADGLRELYEREMARARDFVRAKGLVTIPEGEALSVVDTPVFLRGLLPYAAYGPPGPFEKVQKGLFFVTPVDPDASQEERELQLQGHGLDGIRVIALHEGYPGHHVQLVRANGVESRTRKLARSNLFIEGWALYCEEMMREAGFFEGPSMRLVQQKAVLWRSVRVVVDVRLQRGEMTLEEAADYMVEAAALTPDKAAAEVSRYSMNPTQPSSYLLGKLAITGIRERYEERAGESFDLRSFHDELLDLGSIPPRLVERSLGLER